MPAFATLGGVALILFWSADQPIAAIPVAHYSLVTNPALPTLPLFTMAGYFMAEGGAPKRLVRAFYALFGQFRGGLDVSAVGARHHDAQLASAPRGERESHPASGNDRDRKPH